ncbi:MAG: helix-turn-helix domain-containing protein [Betaproteobacteria bacterium]|nr:helix-turn-helix domain-containing protein [Betaproteobacteria bacterium]
MESIELLRPEIVAELLDVDVATLAAWRSTRRKDLPFVKFGHRSVRYRRADVQAFIVRHLVQASALARTAA